MFIVVGALIWGDMINNYNLNSSQDLASSEVFNITQNMYDETISMKDETLAAELEGEDQTWDSMIKGGYSAVRLIKNSFGLVGGLIGAVGKTFHIPEEITIVAIVAIVLTIIFGIIYLVFRFKP